MTDEATPPGNLDTALERELQDGSAARIERRAVNAHLIGQPGSRARLNTPALLIDVDAMSRNLARMAERCASAGVALRPHAKTHKSAHIARLQLAAGAAGICVAKPGEAEALAADGIRRLLITSPIAGEDAIRRFVALHAHTDDLILAVDHPAILDRLEAAARQAGIRVSFVVDIDVGLKRTGTNDPEAALHMAKRGVDSAALQYRGIQAYGGHLQHIGGRAARHEATAGAMRGAQAIVERLRAEGLAPELVTGGGTGTHRADIEQSFLNDIQAGSYPFMDSQYHHALADEDGGGFETALRVQTTIISINAPEWVTVDGGTKSFATDGPAPEPLSPRFAGADYLFMGDEHGVVMRGDKEPEPGERVEFAAPHCDPTVNLYDFYHLVRGGTLVGIWPVTARGASF
ncbi:MAG: DSD1 family PLP-dependent enzyme [Alphaproteobacteria bacterium]